MLESVINPVTYVVYVREIVIMMMIAQGILFVVNAQDLKKCRVALVKVGAQTSLKRIFA